MLHKKSEKRSYETRVALDEKYTATCREYARVMNHASRTLFAAIASGVKADACKSSYQKRFGITARQFNSCRVAVEGAIESIKERRTSQILESKARVKDLEKTIQKLEKKKSNPRSLHQKKRRLYNLTSKLTKLEKDHATGKTRLCFGTKKLFHAQFALKENGYDCHEDWKKDWQKERNNSFFLMGSKDETCGNQSCKASIEADGSFTLHLRLPDVLVKGNEKYLVIPNVRFAYGHDVITASLLSCQTRNALYREKNSSYKEHGEAISYRFLEDKKGFRIFVTTALVEKQWVTNKEFGVIGVDINADHVAITETDRFGNCIRHESFPWVCYGKSHTQTEALSGDLAKKLVDLAIASRKPLVIERLDFQKKKSALKESSTPKQARMLSSFAYKTLSTHIRSRSFRFGVEVEEVNPAFTSLIGRIKFAKRYGLSVHEAAAFCIARRALGVSERLPRHEAQVPDGKGDHVAFSLPVRNRDKHVWSSWRIVQRKFPVVLAAHFRAKRSSSRPPPA